MLAIQLVVVLMRMLYLCVLGAIYQYGTCYDDDESDFTGIGCNIHAENNQALYGGFFYGGRFDNQSPPPPPCFSLVSEKPEVWCFACELIAC